MRTLLDDDGDIPEEEDADAWFSGYTTGKETALADVHQAMGRFAPFTKEGDPILVEATIIEAVAKLATQLEECL